nr:hypothetical protein [Pseudoalteromonas sp. BDTF-M6]
MPQSLLANVGQSRVYGRALTMTFAFALVNFALLFSGTLGDVAELEALLGNGLQHESVLVTLAQFLAHPVLSAQLLIGLCWLLFHVFVAKRTGIFLRKAAFAFVAPTRSQPVQDAHGCRAPPLIAG